MLFKKKIQKTTTQNLPDTGRRRPVMHSDAYRYNSSRQSYTYYSKRSATTGAGRQNSPLRTGKRVHLRARWLLRHGVILVASAVILVCVVNELIVTPNVKVTVLNADKHSKLILKSDATYAQAANQLIARTPTNRNKLTINTTAMVAALEKQFPELSDVSIVLPMLGHRPVVYIEPSSTAFLLETNADGSFVVGKSGKALAAVTPDRAAQLSIPKIIDKSGLTVRIGQQALSGADGNFMSVVVRELQAGGFEVSKLVLPPASREVDIYLVGQTYFGKFNLESSDARQQAGAFMAVARQLQEEHKQPASYIDVRVDGRAYYK